jgi:hypothetical protein
MRETRKKDFKTENKELYVPLYLEFLLLHLYLETYLPFSHNFFLTIEMIVKNQKKIYNLLICLERWRRICGHVRMLLLLSFFFKKKKEETFGCWPSNRQTHTPSVAGPCWIVKDH